MEKPNLLFITPTVPNSRGNGRSIRAYNFLQALSSKYSIYLLVVSHSFRSQQITSTVSGFCKDIKYIPVKPIKDIWIIIQFTMLKFFPKLFPRFFSKPPEWIYITKQRIKFVSRAFSGINFDVIHVFRLYMTPFAGAYLNKAFHGTYELDLDDIESLTRDSLSRLYLINNDKKRASLLEHESKVYEFIERNLLPVFDRIFVCSDADKLTINNRYECKQVEVVPNIVKIPLNLPEKTAAKTFSFLFVGAFQYYPNYDGIIYFCDKILPLIRQKVGQEFNVKVAGSGIPKKLARILLQIPEVKIVGHVLDLQPIYGDSDTVIVPIRAGGGTRIKVLEAFSYRKPLVSTSIGVEGINVKNGEHVLLGDTPEEFAHHCIQIMLDPEIRKKLTKNAFVLIKTFYNLEAIKQKIL
jgi:glycosyltransferase involved in cell wall biosynthesis